MPIYVYQCNRCDVRTEVFVRRQSTTLSAPCQSCGSADTDRVFTPFVVYKSELDKMQALDPTYYRRVDEAMEHSAPYADPMNHLKRMTPFEAAKEAGDPIRGWNESP